MIQAYLTGKLKIEDNRIKKNEDLKTSSLFGLLQYLPEDSFWKIFCDFCINLKKEKFGKIVSFNFWPHTEPTNTTNALFVEPDLWIETENFDIIIEAKLNDQIGQDKSQWENEIQSIINEQRNRNDLKPIILIALGGNENMDPDEVKNCKIYKASWFSLVNSVVNARDKHIDHGNICRILDDLIDLMARQGVMKIKWMNSLVGLNMEINHQVLNEWPRLKIVKPIGFDTIRSKNINEKYLKQWKPIC